MMIRQVTQQARAVALITGASSGIGAATASLLATSGFRVFGTSRAPTADPRRPFPLVPLDVRSDASVAAAVRHVLAQAGRIDLLVNSAGYAQAGALEENSLDDARAQFDTNVFGVLRVTNAVLPGMRAQRSGRIVNVSSLVGHVAPAYLGLYAGTKFALEGLSEALRAELRPFGVAVSLVEPGFVRTGLAGRSPAQPLAAYDVPRGAALAGAREGIERGLPPAVVAQAVLRIATAPRPGLRYRVGRTSTLLIALKRLLPEPAFERVRRRAFKGEAAAADSRPVAAPSGLPG
jgi:NAD(P)-dependent dehydrogenase (short-subunit alcohol dehydrogenase family)